MSAPYLVIGWCARKRGWPGASADLWTLEELEELDEAGGRWMTIGLCWTGWGCALLCAGGSSSSSDSGEDGGGEGVLDFWLYPCVWGASLWWKCLLLWASTGSGPFGGATAESLGLVFLWIYCYVTCLRDGSRAAVWRALSEGFKKGVQVEEA